MATAFLDVKVLMAGQTFTIMPHHIALLYYFL